MQRGALLLVATLIATLAAGSAVARATTLQPIGNYTAPLFVTSEPDPDRLLVVEQGGTIRLTHGGSTDLFLDISNLVTPGGEDGLLSMAIAPDYETSKHFYVFYVNATGNLQVDEFTASATPNDTRATRRGLLTITHPGTNHNAGQLQFGPDDFLYISTGESGMPALAQDTSSLLGKILRIDPDPDPPAEYSIPPGNPFADPTDGAADEIWSYGFRNPFRFSFDSSTGALLIGDVGGANAEEVDYEPQPDGGRGDNFGWPCREGFGAGPSSCTGAFTDPIHDYGHSSDNCSITGGYVARDPGLGSLVGRYVYADFCSGQVRSLVPGLPRASCDRSENLNVPNPSSFGEDSSGRLYIASLTNGTVHRLVGDSTAVCPAPPDPPPEPDPADDPVPPADEPPHAARPTLRIRAPERQTVDDERRVVCVLRSDQSTEAVTRLALIAGGDVLLRPDEKRLGLEPDTGRRVGWKLSRADVRSIRRPLRDGRLEARFRARPLDAAGELGFRVEVVSALRN